jgi:hypothetical protein
MDEWAGTKAAEQLLRLKLDSETQARPNDLADKAAEGRLSEVERTEYLTFSEAIDLLSIAQAKARNFLRRQRPE